MNELQEKLLAWFETNGRQLPWRKTYDPYQVWIAEIMLQQTQMDRVVTYFKRWMSRYPDLAALAGGNEEEVLKLWEGLGYYARARNILKSAAILQAEYNGQLPADHDLLLGLPGIGKYTAAAVMSIAFNRDYPLVDANIERFFARLFNLPKPVKDKQTNAYIWQKASELLPKGRARLFNQALMELGALVCLAGNPRCRICPVRSHCQAFGQGLVSERPVPPAPAKTVFIEMATGILWRRGKVLIQKRKASGVWANLWEFPGGRLEAGETPEMALKREYLEETGLAVNQLEKIVTVHHSYTIYRVTLHCFFCSGPDHNRQPVLDTAQEYRWVTPAELSNFAFPAGHRKLIQHLKNNPDLFRRF